MRGKNVVSFTCNVSQHRIKATRQEVDQSEEHKRSEIRSPQIQPLQHSLVNLDPKLRLSATHCNDNRIKSGVQVTIKRGGEKLKTGGTKEAVASGAHKLKEIVPRQASAHIAIANTC